MGRELWPLLYRELREVADDFRQKYVQISGWALAAVSLGAALQDRPAAWACDARKRGAPLAPPGSCPPLPP